MLWMRTSTERDWTFVAAVALVGLLLGYFLAVVWALIAAVVLAIALRNWSRDRRSALIVLWVAFIVGGVASIVLGTPVSGEREGGSIEGEIH